MPGPTRRPNTVQNDCLNGGFDFFSRGAAISCAITELKYAADRWVIQNNFTGDGVITGSGGSSGVPGSFRNMTVYVATAPTIPQANAGHAYYTMDNITSRKYIGKKASFQLKVQGYGNVNQVTIQLRYATTETQATNPFGPAIVVPINPSTPTLCEILNVPADVLMTAAGCLGVSITATAVSTGNLSDVNNGLILDQGGFYAGLPPTYEGWRRMYPTLEEEIVSLRRYFETSYLDGTTPGTAASFGNALIAAGDYAGVELCAGVRMVEKRIVPTVVAWDPDGNINQVRGLSNAGYAADNGVAVRVTKNDFALQGVNSHSFFEFDWTADAEMPI